MRRIAAWFVVALGGILSPAPVFLSQNVAVAQATTASIEFLNVGQGDATLIRTPEGKVALIDAGPSGRIVQLLRQRDVAKIDLIVLSHHHIDHYGGMDEVVREFGPTAFLVSESSFTSPTYLKLLKLIRDEGIPTIFPNRDGLPRKIELGSVILTVLPQPPEDFDNENNNSIGLRVQHGDAAALLTGDSQDSERAAWRDHPKAKELCSDCSLLKLAHHGSRNGTDASWLDLVKPKLAVAMCGLNNQFHHPSPETIALLGSRSIPLKRTDQDGPVLVVSDGHQWTLAGASPVAAAANGGQPAAPAADRTEDDAPASGGKVNLNSATEEELKELPGIGPALAKRIIAARPYEAIEDLDGVQGIGPKKIELLRPFVTVRRSRGRGTPE